MGFQFDILSPEPCVSPPNLPDRLGGLVGLDFETHDPELTTKGAGWRPGGVGHVIGVALSWEGGSGYWPLYHEMGNVENPEQVWRWLQDQAKNPDVTFVAHNALYELGWLGIEPINPFHDTWLMSSILDDSRMSNSLDSVLRDELGLRKKDRMLLEGARRIGVNPKKIKEHMKKLPGPYVSEYAEWDADGCRQVAVRLLEKLEAEGLMSAYERERRLMPILYRMRMEGVRVDVDKAERIREDLRSQEATLQAEIKKLTGFSIDVWSADSLAKGFQARSVGYPTGKNGKPSFQKEFLEKCDDPLAQMSLKIRRLQKLRSTFVEGYILDLHYKGKIYPEINQTKGEDGGGTNSGRFSYQNPNLQNLPGRDEDSKELIRGLIIPDDPDEEKIISVDYSQQEPRITVHFATLCECRGATEAAERYRNDPTTDFHQMVADITALKRKDAKILNLAIIYGQGDGTTCEKLGLSTEPRTFTGRNGMEVTYMAPGEKGQALISQYHRNLPFAKEIDDIAKRRMRQRGYILTLGGRKMRARRDERGRPWEDDIRKALNKLIQGSAADQTKEAMILCAEAGILPKIQVHDELVFSNNPRHVPVIREAMMNALPLVVPAVVDVEVGPNWGELAPYGE